MGTINYKTSEYITLGYNCDDIDNEELNDYYYTIEDNYNQIRWLLDKYRFTYFHITVEPGYYEGYALNIEFNYPVCFDGWEDRRQAQKEITVIKKFLLECINDFGCVSVYPGWCTEYADRQDTLKDLSDAVADMRDTVRHTPTWQQYHGERLAQCF